MEVGLVRKRYVDVSVFLSCGNPWHDAGSFEIYKALQQGNKRFNVFNVPFSSSIEQQRSAERHGIAAGVSMLLRQPEG
jgi:hypothetical protein